MTYAGRLCLFVHQSTFGRIFLSTWQKINRLTTLAAAGGASILTTGPAHALPAFARQTGMECISCHVGGFGPQLTPRGIKFKLGGYSDTGGTGPAANVPLSAMIVGSFTHLAKGLTEDPGPNDGKNNNGSLQEVSAFLAGRLFDHAGSFTQVTYSDIDNKVALDAVDLRYAAPLTLAGDDFTLGVTLNNNPSQTDPFNTLPAWRFPYTSTELGMSPVASPLLDGGLEHQVAGASVYGFWDGFYAELGGYRSLDAQTLRHINVADEAGKISGVAPYWRLAYFKDTGMQAFSAGVFGLNADLHPGRMPGRTDQYDDVGVDGSYRFLPNRHHQFAVNTAYIHEHRKLNGSFGAQDAAHSSGTLNRFDLNGSYYFDNTWGLTAGVFDITGSRDAGLYGADSLHNDPDSNGWIMQGDWTPFGKEASWGAPWVNLRLGLQYTAYNTFNGAKHNYDGSGRDASDNNSLFAFAWTAF